MSLETSPSSLNHSKAHKWIKVDFYLQLILVLISLILYLIQDRDLALFLVSILCLYDVLSSWLNLFIFKHKNYLAWSIVNLITAIIIPLHTLVVFWGFGMALDPNGPQPEKFPNGLVYAIVNFYKLIGFDNLELPIIFMGIVVIFVNLSYLVYTFQNWQKLKLQK